MTKRQEKLLIAMCWLLYVSAYLGRYSYTTNILPISNFYNVEKDVVSLATTFFFFAYGAGQIINGLLCRFYKVKYVLSGALIASAVINLLDGANLERGLILTLELIALKIPVVVAINMADELEKK